MPQPYEWPVESRVWGGSRPFTRRISRWQCQSRSPVTGSQHRQRRPMGVRKVGPAQPGSGRGTWWVLWSSTRCPQAAGNRSSGSSAAGSSTAHASRTNPGHGSRGDPAARWSTHSWVTPESSPSRRHRRKGVDRVERGAVLAGSIAEGRSEATGMMPHPANVSGSSRIGALEVPDRHERHRSDAETLALRPLVVVVGAEGTRPLTFSTSRPP